MKKYIHLQEEERIHLSVLWNDGNHNKSSLAKILGRDRTTIGREIDRNKTMLGTMYNNDPPNKKKEDNYRYLPERAHAKYLRRRKDSKQRCPLKTLELRAYVLEKLSLHWSPYIIAGRAALENIGTISGECIYQYIYSREAAHLELWKLLPRHHKKRHAKRGRKANRTLIPNRVGIEERPKEVEDRKEFGHWEGDSIVGVGKGAALNTVRERKSRYMMVTKIPRKTARYTRLATCRRFKNLPSWAKKTNTDDNGSEFTEHEQTTKQTGIRFFFARAYASWQRGTNENGNGLVRRFFPKRTDFNTITAQEIQAVEDWINHRPLKCLGFKTPHEVFHEELALCPPSV